MFRGYDYAGGFHFGYMWKANEEKQRMEEQKKMYLTEWYFLNRKQNFTKLFRCIKDKNPSVAVNSWQNHITFSLYNAATVVSSFLFLLLHFISLLLFLSVWCFLIKNPFKKNWNKKFLLFQKNVIFPFFSSSCSCVCFFS